MRCSLFVVSSLLMGCALDTSGVGSDGGGPSSTTAGSSGTTTSPGTSAASTSVADAEGSGASTAAETTTATTSGDTSADGTTDVDPPSCADDNGGCDPDATCRDGSGTVVCTCNPGYEGDGRRCSVDATLPTLRIEVPCMGPMGCNNPYCNASNSETDEAVLGGNPAVSYEVTLRFRGVIEEKNYFGGDEDGFWNEGGNPDNDGWNTYSLDISTPAQTYWLNSGNPGADHCQPVDYQRTLSVMGGSTVRVAMNDTNNCAAPNNDDQGEPIVIPGIPPDPMAFDGQFLQVDVVDIVPVP